MMVRVLIRIDFVPLNSVTLKSGQRKICQYGLCGARAAWQLTVVNVDLIAATRHGGGVVAEGELAKGWQASGSHPDLELWHVVEVGQRELGIVAVGIPEAPVGWGNDIVDGVCGGVVQVLVRVPGDALVGHDVRHVVGIGACTVESDGAVEGVVELRVGNEAARIVCLARGWIQLEWIAVAVANGIVALELAIQLVLIEALDISPVVLVKVCESIVEENGGGEVVGDVKLQAAHVCRHIGTRAEGVHSGAALPGRRICSRSVVFEVACDVV